MGQTLWRVTRRNRADAIAAAAGALERGLLVVLPTDTVYGVGALPKVVGAEQRLYDAKGRDGSKPVALLAADTEAARRYGAVFCNEALALADRFWPGALTLVLKVDDGCEGFRVPRCGLARDLLRAAGGVLRVSSANLSGEPPATTAAAAMRVLGQSVAVVLDHGPSPIGQASTVVKVDGKRMELIRVGSISREEMEACCKCSIAIQGRG